MKLTRKTKIAAAAMAAVTLAGGGAVGGVMIAGHHQQAQQEAAVTRILDQVQQGGPEGDQPGVDQQAANVKTIKELVAKAGATLSYTDIDVDGNVYANAKWDNGQTLLIRWGGLSADETAEGYTTGTTVITGDGWGAYIQGQMDWDASKGDYVYSYSPQPEQVAKAMGGTVMPGS